MCHSGWRVVHKICLPCYQSATLVYFKFDANLEVKWNVCWFVLLLSSSSLFRYSLILLCQGSEARHRTFRSSWYTNSKKPETKRPHEAWSNSNLRIHTWEACGQTESPETKSKGKGVSSALGKKVFPQIRGQNTELYRELTASKVSKKHRARP